MGSSGEPSGGPEIASDNRKICACPQGDGPGGCGMETETSDSGKSSKSHAKHEYASWKHSGGPGGGYIAIGCSNIGGKTGGSGGGGVMFRGQCAPVPDCVATSLQHANSFPCTKLDVAALAIPAVVNELMVAARCGIFLAS